MLTMMMLILNITLLKLVGDKEEDGCEGDGWVL